MKGKEIMNFLKKQIIIDTPIEHINEVKVPNKLMSKYKERVRIVYDGI